MKGIGKNDATLLMHEIFWRDFRNRRELASWVGITPTPRGQLKQRVRAQRVAVVGILVTAGDRQHAEAEHGRERVDHLCLIAPVADAACQGLGRT